MMRVHGSNDGGLGRFSAQTFSSGDRTFLIRDGRELSKSRYRKPNPFKVFRHHFKNDGATNWPPGRLFLSLESTACAAE
jgi:hypothetical protein